MSSFVRRRFLLGLAAMLAVITGLFSVPSSAMAMQQAPPPFRSTVQVNSSSEFNETAHFAGGPYTLTIPVLKGYLTCPTGGCPMIPVYATISLVVESGTQTPAQIATAIANQINNNADLQARGVKAKAVNDSVSISSPDGPPTSGTPAKPTVTGAQNSNGSGNDNRIYASFYAR